MKTRAQKVVHGVLIFLSASVMMGSFGPPPATADGVTIITHGWDPSLSGSPAWLASMRSDLAARHMRGESNFGTITVTGDSGLASGACTDWNVGLGSSETGEIVVILDWSSVANHLVSRISAQKVAAAALPRIMAGQEGAPPLAELPIHLIGHSRGSSVVSQLAQYLGEHGIFVDQLTLLDPHPLTASDPQPSWPFPKVIDPPVAVRDNVVFADCYYQTIAYPQGQAVAGAYGRQWAALPGGYHDNASPGNAYADHRNIYLAYQATVNLASPLSNGEATLLADDRAAWFCDGESSGSLRGECAGFYYSRADGRGNRRRAVAPLPGGAPPIDGLHDHSLIGGNGGRQTVEWYGDGWPNIVKLEIARGEETLGWGIHEIGAREVVQIRFIGFDYNSATNVTLFIDADRNPYNRNQFAVITSTHQEEVGETLFEGTAPLAGSMLPGGEVVWIGATITDGARTRHFYALPAVQGAGTGTETRAAGPWGRLE